MNGTLDHMSSQEETYVGYADDPFGEGPPDKLPSVTVTITDETLLIYLDLYASKMQWRKPDLVRHALRAYLKTMGYPV